jgi:acyl-CoA synthetase (AMP-forming)/AMP-acid ligase II
VRVFVQKRLAGTAKTAASATAKLGNAFAVVRAMDSLSELLTRHVHRQPERIAVATSDLRTVISYRQLDTLVRSAAAQLSSLGVSRGDTVALISDNSVDFVVGLLANLFLGAPVAPLNPALMSNELSTRVSALSAKAMLCPKHHAGQLDNGKSAAGDAARWIMSIEGSDNAFAVSIANADERASKPYANAKKSLPMIHSDDVAVVMFTAGSTSAPKVVPLTHGNMVEAIRGISSVYDLSPQDATLVVMPLFHGHGLIAGLLSTLASGGGAYLPSTGVFSAHLFWPDMIRVGATWYTAVPTIHRILVNRAPNEYPSSSPVALRFIRSCSAPLDEALAAATSTAFGAPVIAAYGMTETSHQTTSNPLPSHGANKTQSVGLPTGVELRIIADDGKDAATGTIGEIWVRGATVTAGYLNNPGANSASFAEGWFRSGDLGCRDADDYVFVQGRLKDVINRGGDKISPNEIDTVLLSNPKILEAASFGEPDSIYGEDVHAAVVLRPGADSTESELQEYCRSMLGGFEVPERIHIVTDLPRTAKGSIDRRALARTFAGRAL